MNGGLIGGIIGGVMGLLGGALGTYLSIKNTKGPVERTFMIKAAACMWVGVAFFLLLLFLLPKPYDWMLWIPYGVLLPVSIIYINIRLKRIRKQDTAT